MQSMHTPDPQHAILSSCPACMQRFDFLSTQGSFTSSRSWICQQTKLCLEASTTHCGVQGRNALTLVKHIPHMPEFICVQCFSCDTFQVQQVKKTAKYVCRMCQASQSVRKVYAISSQAKDVRSVVMQLNAKRGKSEEPAVKVDPGQACAATMAAKESTSWSGYLADNQVQQDTVAAGEDMADPLDEFVTCLPDHGRPKRKFLQHEDKSGKLSKVKGSQSAQQAPLGRSQSQAMCLHLTHQTSCLPASTQARQLVSHNSHKPGQHEMQQGSNHLPVLKPIQQQPLEPKVVPIETAYHHGSSYIQASPADYDAKNLPGAASGVSLPIQATSQKTDDKSSSWSQYLSNEDNPVYEQGNFDLSEGGDDLVTSLD